MALQCDYLIPAALGSVINETNAEQISAKVVVEAANSPVTEAADHSLEERGIPVLPDILVNAGGVTVSYFEWVQNLQQFSWSLDTVQERLRRRLETASKDVFELATTDKCSYRDAAYQIATRRLKDAFYLAGF